MARVFVSYSTPDRKFVEQLVHKLQLRLVDVWYDRFEIKVGDSIIRKIEEGISSSDWLLVIISKASIRSKWVREELDAGIRRTIEKGAFVLPALEG